MSERLSAIWWDNITGPNHFLETVSLALLENKSVIVYAPDDLPWRKQMRYSLAEMLRGNPQELTIEPVDVALECRPNSEGEIDVSAFLLERFAPSFKNGYRESSGKTIQQYFLENGVLDNLVVWVKGMSEKTAKTWFEFCKRYKPNKTNKGLFVLEVYLPEPFSSVPKTLMEIYYRDYVTLYDALLFNYMVVSEQQGKDSWLQYIATISTNLCESDVELSCALIEGCDFRTKGYIDTLCNLASTEDFRRRFAADNLRDNHPFTLIKNEQYEHMTRSIWLAQLKVVFPLIEMERLALIEMRKEDLEAAIAEDFFNAEKGKHGRLNYFGREITDPFDLELGTLQFMTKLWFESDHERCYFPLPSAKDQRRLDLLHEMRCKIAHMDVCTIEEILAFFDDNPYSWHFPKVFAEEQR